MAAHTGKSMDTPSPALELRDIHLPDALLGWPPALGWWLVLGMLLAVAVVLGYFWRHKRRNRLRDAALAELERLVADHARHQDARQLATALSHLLRRVCLSPLWHPGVDRTATPGVAGLTGEAWLQFLDQALEGEPFSRGAGRWLLSLPFQPQATAPVPDTELTALIAVCRSWIQHAATPRQGNRVSP
ncbi:MAG: DUF4381 domain-containing protein [Magnetococcus sp. MYC-9]